MGFECNQVNVKEINNKKLPALYRRIEEGNRGEVAMFLTKESCLIVAAYSNSYWKIGELDGGWISCFDTDVWERLPEGSSFTFTQE
jgi:hypothetical protein